jgi:hypothetical protein
VTGAPDEKTEITLDMISAGVDAYLEFEEETEEPEALVFEIIHRAFEIAKRNAGAVRTRTPENAN